MNIPQVPKDITDAKQMQDYMTGIQKALTQKQIDDDKSGVGVDAKITAVGDGIIESGSNSNGRWIKFRDGTMICWHQTGILGSGQVGVIPYPTLFLLNSTVCLSVSPVPYNAWLYSVVGFGGWGGYTINTSGPGNAAQIIAIGRWK